MKFYAFVNKKRTAFVNCDGRLLVGTEMTSKATMNNQNGIYCFNPEWEVSDSFKFGKRNVFGSDIAFLECDEKDVVSRDGVCRLKSCVITDIKDVMDCDFELLSKSVDFAICLFKELVKESQTLLFDIRWVEFFDANKGELNAHIMLGEYGLIVDEYTQEFEDMLADKIHLGYAAFVAIKREKFFGNQKILDHVVFDPHSDTTTKRLWNEVFGRDLRIDEHMKLWTFVVYNYVRYLGLSDVLKERILGCDNEALIKDMERYCSQSLQEYLS